MYFPIDNTKFDPLPRVDTSLGDDPDFLLLVKRLCGLPADPTWTESDDLIKMYIDAAEDFIDALAVLVYRPRSYTLFLSSTRQNVGSIRAAVDMNGCPFTGIRLPKGPVIEGGITVSVLEEDDTEFTPFTSWRLVAGSSSSPEIVFNRDVVLPSVSQPYPIKVDFETTAEATNRIQKLAIMQLTDYYFKNPESVGTKNLPGIAGVFWDSMLRLGAGGYA